MNERSSPLEMFLLGVYAAVVGCFLWWKATRRFEALESRAAGHSRLGQHLGMRQDTLEAGVSRLERQSDQLWQWTVEHEKRRGRE